MVDGKRFCGIFSSREKAIQMARNITHLSPLDYPLYKLIPDGFYIHPVEIDEFDNYTW